ncbi:MerR family transcriptional regulator, partial [Streptomyces albiflaviniger]|nr:MerR family transcriptional regulator [Streptomyces albiflaviniger]
RERSRSAIMRSMRSREVLDEVIEAASVPAE